MKRGISETQRKRASGFKGGERKPGGGRKCVQKLWKLWYGNARFS